MYSGLYETIFISQKAFVFNLNFMLILNSVNINFYRMKSPIKIVLCGLFAVVFLAGCSGGGSFEGIKLIGSAKGAEQSTIGKNLRMVYVSAGTLAQVCDEQSKLLIDAGYKASEELRDEKTYKTAPFTADKNTLTLMCSEQDGSTDIKVTMTLQKGE